MLICHCKRVNDRRIRQAVRDGARTVAQVGRESGAGTCCGGCVTAVVELLDEERAVQHYQPLPIAAE